LTVTVPELGATRSPTIRSSVDLPQPDGPIRETNSPRWTAKSMPDSAWTRRPPRSSVPKAIDTSES